MRRGSGGGPGPLPIHSHPPFPGRRPAVTERVPSPAAIPVGMNGGNTPQTPSADEMQPLRSSQAVVASPAETKPEIARKDRLFAATRSLLRGLSGHDFSEVDAYANFVELGLDSLLLAQAAQLFERKFGVSISFRQLMEELSSLDAIASYMDARLPPEAFAEKPATPPSAPSPTHAVADSQSAVLEEILRQQQQLTNQVLQLLGREPAAISPHPASSLSTAILAPPPASEVKSQHGPFKPISRGAEMVLSPRQQRALDALIARYTARTAGSKKLAAQNRPVLADPR